MDKRSVYMIIENMIIEKIREIESQEELTEELSERNQRLMRDTVQTLITIQNEIMRESRESKSGEGAFRRRLQGDDELY